MITTLFYCKNSMFIIITKEALQYKKKKKKFITTKNMLLTKYIKIQDVQYVT